MPTEGQIIYWNLLTLSTKNENNKRGETEKKQKNETVNLECLKCGVHNKANEHELELASHYNE